MTAHIFTDENDALGFFKREEPISAIRQVPKPKASAVKRAFSGGCTDVRNAERLVELHGDDLRYIEAWGKWLVWSGSHWTIDATGGAMRCAIDTARQMAGEAADGVKRTTDAMVEAEGEGDRALAKGEHDRARASLAWALKSQSAGHLGSMLALAKTNKRISVTHDTLDADPMLLNVVNGTIDLRTGTFRPAVRDELLTKVAGVAYDATATCPTWEAFLSRAMAGDVELIAFLQRFVGYALTGSIDEHAVVFCYGGGQNGKSTFLGIIHAMLGAYAKPAPRGLLFRSRGERHPTELATLFGARFVTCSEIDEGQAFDEALVKDLTGGDPISARQMREDFWTFNPTHKFFLAGNHKPTVRGSDEGIWRRMRLVPWTVQIPAEERDTGLPAKLRAELPGILVWAVQGCLAWQRQGLGDPSRVRDATAAYRQESNPLGEFLSKHCSFHDQARITRRALREAYESYAKDSGLLPVGAKRFTEALRERGVKDTSVRNLMGKPVDGWSGVRLMTSEEFEFCMDVGTSRDVKPYNPLRGDPISHGNRNSTPQSPYTPTADDDDEDDREPDLKSWLDGSS